MAYYTLPRIPKLLYSSRHTFLDTVACHKCRPVPEGTVNVPLIVYRDGNSFPGCLSILFVLFQFRFADRIAVCASLSRQVFLNRKYENPEEAQ